MDFWVFIIVIVSIGWLGTIIQGGMKIARAKVRVQEAEAASGGVAAQGVAADMQNEIARLKERVATLEKLVTDDDRRLADEIERLRRPESRV